MLINFTFWLNSPSRLLTRPDPDLMMSPRSPESEGCVTSHDISHLTWHSHVMPWHLHLRRRLVVISVVVIIVRAAEMFRYLNRYWNVLTYLNIYESCCIQIKPRPKVETRGVKEHSCPVAGCTSLLKTGASWTVCYVLKKSVYFLKMLLYYSGWHFAFF